MLGLSRAGVLPTGRGDRAPIARAYRDDETLFKKVEAIEPPGIEPFLARQLGNKDPSVRRHAVRSLVRLGTTSALRRIVIALRDDNPRVRMTVSKALASCPHPIARNTLERLSVDAVESVAAFARSQL